MRYMWMSMKNYSSRLLFITLNVCVEITGKTLKNTLCFDIIKLR